MRSEGILGAPWNPHRNLDSKRSKKESQQELNLEPFGEPLGFEKWLIFLCGFGPPFGCSWEAPWPPSAVNSSKNRGPTFCAKVCFLSDSGSHLSSFWEPLGPFWRVCWHRFLSRILRSIFEALGRRRGSRIRQVGGVGGARRAEAQKTLRTVLHAGVTSLERGAADLSGCAHAADPWAPKPGFWLKYGRFGLREVVQTTRRACRIHLLGSDQ